MSLLRRIRGLIGGGERDPEASSSSAPAGEDASGKRSRRRRGRRGGRGRRRGGGSDNAQSQQQSQQHGGPITPTAEAPTRTRNDGERTRNDGERTRNDGERRRNDGRRRRDDGERRRDDGGRRRDDGGRGRYDRRGRRRADLDAPLPEDVAFRPAAEGGDSSILPGRRRPPPGARTTPRVLVTGKRNLPVFHDVDDDDAPPEPEEAPEAVIDNTADDDSADGASDGASGAEEAASGGRRRRGRRGGRGRRRGEREEAAEDAAPSANGNAARTPDATRAEATLEAEADANLELPEAFAALGISERSLTAVARMGFEQPTPVQERSIPVLLEGRDVVGIAQTGTGKTLAFGIPMADSLDPEQNDVQGLVLVPTRELAQQVLGVLIDLSRPFGMQAIGLLGGHALEGDFRALEQGPQIVVGTPGRIKDHLRRGTLSLRRVRLAVLDEADQMLDIGFLPDITHILGRTPRSRQTALFSATMPHTVTRLIRRYMENPERVAVASDLETVESIEHVYFEVAQRDKVNGLSELIERELRGRTLVFSRTKRGVDFLARELQGRGVNVGALHGDLDQRRRDRMVRRFRNGELDILIATNVAARGIDIPEITHVVNYDVPDNAEEYVHRTGRTGRAGREGKAITFASEMDLDRFDVLRETFGDRLRKERLDLYV